MSEINFGCELEYVVSAPTTFLLNLGVAQTNCQRIIREQLQFTPFLNTELLELGLEHNRVHRITVLPCNLLISYEGAVQLDAEIDPTTQLNEQPFQNLPADVLPYLNPSRYCESDLLGNFAMSEFGGLAQGYSRVKAICDWTYQHLIYSSGSTDSKTTARDVLVQRRGVCRDFAHLAISLCRGLSIPARYVSGYAIDLQPPDFHGFFEAYLGERWYLFDATRLALTGGLVRIATGHDAADVPFATLMGTASLKRKNVWAQTNSPTPVPQPMEGKEGISTA